MVQKITKRLQTGCWMAAATVAMFFAAVSPATAQQATNNSTTSAGNGSTVIIQNGSETLSQLTANNSSGLGSLLEAGGTGSPLMDLFAALVWMPFKILATQLLEMVATVLTHTPAVASNPAVQSVHGLTFQVALAFTGLAVVATGILYMMGPVFGLTFRQVRMVLPRIIVALVFAAVSLELLQYSVDATNALTRAFAPSELAFTDAQLAGVAVQLVVVWLVQAILLLVVVVMFVIRDVYLLFAAAISPLLAIAWAFPKSRRFADNFISGWWAALAMAPLDVLVLRFSAELMKMQGTGLQGVSNWVFGIAAYSLLIIIPLNLYGMAQSAVGQAYLIGRGAKRRYRDYRRADRNDGNLETRPPRGGSGSSRGDNKFGDKTWRFEDD